ncbi:MAG: hypothetical protein Q7R39_09200 [Dehalococcoidia bacterium]|nr:hypothetical protein [Dehalococcoidia bacterium]
MSFGRPSWDTIYVPVDLEHLHINHDVERPARFMGVTSRMPGYAGFDQLKESLPITGDRIRGWPCDGEQQSAGEPAGRPWTGKGDGGRRCRSEAYCVA